jgi:Mg2+ and Co2+ transporter CorA
MNADRRKRLKRAKELIEEARTIVEEVAGEEREGYDNLPESLQSGEKGERMSEVAESLEQMFSDLETMDDGLDEAMQ